MLKGFRKLHLAVFMAFCVTTTFPATPVFSADATYKITANDTSLDNGVLTYTLKGTASPSYTVTERFSPFRVVWDIAGADFSIQPSALPKNEFITMQVEELSEGGSPGKRFIFTPDKDYDYDVQKIGDNAVQIVFTPVDGAVGIQGTESTGVSEEQSSKITLKDFQVISTPAATTIQILADKGIDDYTVDTLEGPNKTPRMFIDIANVNLNGVSNEKVIDSKSLSKVRVTPQGNGIRLIFESATSRLFKYSVNQTGAGLDVVIDETATQKALQSYAPQPVDAMEAKEPPKRAIKNDNKLNELISSSEQITAQDPNEILANKPVDKFAALTSDFSASGYETQKITVDFYKIDIHNVFRLFREITDLNIIVDEDVQGSLTLALNDVPWDFALDIILNLMNLKKEERFNTIVIYPADKMFKWPSRKQDNLAIQPDMQILQEQDSLVIEKTRSQPKEIMKAQELLLQAKNLEEQENLEDAVLLYEKALSLWPTNNRISNRLATIYLVSLGQNAKAVNFATKSLKNNPKDRSAALYAAIASANMQRLPQANEFFVRAISGTPPMKEALISYAAFSENNGMNEAALKLLEKYEQYYGENVNTMIAKARIYDKTGQSPQARVEYQAILNSGYQLPVDLRTYIQARIAGKAK